MKKQGFAMPPPSTRKCLILKDILISSFMVTSLFAAGSAFAFGGGGGGDSSSSPQRYQTGVDSFGTHFGGEGQVQIQFNCVPDEQATSDYGLCTCLAENVEFDYDLGKCICNTGFIQKKDTCVFDITFTGTLDTPYNNCLVFANGVCQECTTNYYLKGSECVQNCGTSWKVADDNKTCTQCDAGEKCDCGNWKEADGNGGCVCTNIPNCTEQNTETCGQCITCANGYYKNVSETCTPANVVTNCEEYEDCTDLNCACKKCETAYFPNGDGSACVLCNTTDGYPMSSTDTDKCGQCDETDSKRKLHTNSQGETNCVLDISCAATFAMDDNGVCKTCLTNEVFLTTSDECKKCTSDSNERLNRTWTEKEAGSTVGYCGRTTCDSESFKDIDGNCVSCNEDKAYKVANEAACTTACPKRSYNAENSTCEVGDCDIGFFRAIEDGIQTCVDCKAGINLDTLDYTNPTSYATVKGYEVTDETECQTKCSGLDFSPFKIYRKIEEIQNKKFCVADCSKIFGAACSYDDNGTATVPCALIMGALGGS